MIITIIAWIVLIVSGLLTMMSCICVFTRETTKDRVLSFVNATFYAFVIILALRFING